MISHVKSFELQERALKVTPGPQSNLAGLWPSSQPMFVARGKGAHLWDVDGNEYIDYTIGLGPGILGYCNEEYTQALKDQLDTLVYLAGWCQSPMEIELAEKFVQHVPCAEMVRFSLSGTEAVQLAIRIARAYTKRRYFIRFEGNYHGWLDNVLGGIVNDNSLDKPFALESDEDLSRTEGRSPTAFEESFKLPWNDIDILERTLEKYGEEVAMIHMEPILCNGGGCPPRPGYLEKVRELCTNYGVVLSFDEVITGFRVALNCAQGIFGVTPDLATFGKAMAGGIPMSAVAGKKELLNLILQQRVIGAGTFNGYPFGLAAALATLKILEKDDGAFYKYIDKVQNRLMEGLKEISKRHCIPMLIQGIRGVFFAHFIDREVAYSPRDLREANVEKQKKFRTFLLEQGINIFHRGRWYVSAGLTEEDIDKTLEVADHVMSKLQ